MPTGTYCMINRVQILMAKKKWLAKKLFLKELRVPAFFIFVGHKYLQCGISGLCSTYHLLCHIHLIPANIFVKNVLGLVYGAIFVVCNTPAAYSEKGEKQETDRTNNYNTSDNAKSNNKGAPQSQRILLRIWHGNIQLLAYSRIADKLFLVFYSDRTDVWI